MNEEIKEILDKLNKLEYDDIHLIICEVISRREIKILLDYITNLQNENERLKREKKKLSNDLAEAILFNQKRCEQNKELKEENAKLKKKNKDLKEYNWKLKNQYQLLEIQKNCAEQKNERLETELNAYNELEKWLNENIVRIVKLQSPKSGVKPYGEEYNYYQNYIVAYKEVLIKINEIRGKK